LAFEVKNSAKGACFNTTAVFLHEAIVSENDVLEAGYTAAGVFAWVNLSSADCRFELQVE